MADRALDAHRVAIRQIAENMVGIEAGEITLKDEGTGRQWTVDLFPFRISRFVVTREDYVLFSQGEAVAADDGKKPIVDVSWNDAIRFCNLVSKMAGLPECYASDSRDEFTCDWQLNGYRLPSEAEWEFACRAGNDQVRYGELSDIAWSRDNSGRRLHEVGTKKPNGFGLYDMIGNVWEWCWDIYDAQVYGPYRVFRGGGWSDPPRGCRASCRRKSHPALRIDDLGFRLAQSIR